MREKLEIIELDIYILINRNLNKSSFFINEL